MKFWVNLQHIQIWEWLFQVLDKYTSPGIICSNTICSPYFETPLRYYTLILDTNMSFTYSVSLEITFLITALKISMCVRVLPVYMFVTTGVHCSRGQKRTSDAMGLELQAVSHHVGKGNGTQVLWKPPRLFISEAPWLRLLKHILNFYTFYFKFLKSSWTILIFWCYVFNYISWAFWYTISVLTTSCSVWACSACSCFVSTGLVS